MYNPNFHANKITPYSLICVLLFFICCKKDGVSDLQPQKINSDASLTIRASSLALTGVISTSYYIENSLPSGYVKDGSRDYTSYIQSAINKYGNLVFPAFPIMVNDNGLVIGSNKTITFLTGSKLVLKQTSLDTYDIIRIADATNVILYNPVIVGDRANHIGTTGESGVGIAIRGSSYVTLYSPNVTNCWGDGIYIGQVDNLINCKTITIKDAYLKKNRRDGISIVSVDGLILENCYAAYSDGTKPFCGINFEANNPSCVMNNINVTNAKTEYNLGSGIQIGLKRMLGQGDRTVTMTFTNHTDIKSGLRSFKAACTNTFSASTGIMYANVKVVNPLWKAPVLSPLFFSTNQSNFKLSVYSPEVYNAIPALLTWTQTLTSLKDAIGGTGILNIAQ